MKRIIEHTKVRLKLLWAIIQSIFVLLFSPLIVLLVGFDIIKLQNLLTSLESDLERIGKESEEKSLW